MNFVDRQEELRRLHRIVEGDEAALVVVWGRRRVGKTRLLLEWVRRDKGLYWVADESAAPLQRRYFAKAAEVHLPGFGEVEYPDWATLLSRLAREARQRQWRGPLVIDELPYLIGPSPELPSVLQRFVDHEGKAAGLVVALAGSSQRMMQGLTLAAHAPLFGRAREVMKLQPISIGYLGEAFGLHDPQRIIEAHALWGGIPRYWELAAPIGELRAAADALVLDPLGPLHEEPTRLLLEESPPAMALRPLLDTIGAGAHRVSEIAGRLGQPATSMSRSLTRLQDMDLVTRETPFGEPERSGKRSLYKLSDPFMRLWFSLVAPKRALLMQATRATRLRLLEEALPGLCATAWEDLCRRAVPRLAARLGGVSFGPARRFWLGQGPEWDVVSEASNGKTLLLGEVKWTQREPSAGAVEEMVGALLSKGTPPGPARARVHHAVFVPHLPRKLRPTASDVHLIDAAAVVSSLRDD